MKEEMDLVITVPRGCVLTQVPTRLIEGPYNTR